MKRMLALSVSFAFGGIVMLFSAMAEEVYNVHELNIVENGTFENPAVYFAVPDDEVNENQSGESWETAMTYANALKKIAQDGGELWLKEGRYTLSASPDVFTSTKEVRIRGGFRGNEKSLAQRPTGLMTIIDGQDTYQTLKVHYTATPSLFYIERMSFQHSAGKGLYMQLPNGLETDIATHVYIVDCDFSNNTLFGTDKPDTGLGLYLKPGYTSCVISNCTFQGNVSAATGTKYGYGAYVDGDINLTKGRVFFESCSFITNGCPDGVTGTAGVGVAFCTKTKPLTLRGCRIVGNRSAVNGNAGIAAFDYQCTEGHAITNCVFVGNQMIAGGGNKGYSSGVVVVRYYGVGQKNQAVDVANCTFAYNIAHYHDQAACAATAHVGTLHFINSIFYGNVINNSATGGADLTANNNGSVTAEYCLFGADADPAGANYGWHFKKDAYDALRITLGEGNIYGDPRFVSDMSAFTNLTVKGTASPKAAQGVPPAFSVPFSPDILSLNVHLRGGSGYTDEVTGEHRVYPGKSKAIDAGDPQSDYSNEPSPNGKRVNLGAYGNTPYATRSPYAGFRIIVR